MIREDLKKLTDEEINGLIAKACGWKHGICECGHETCDKSLRWFNPIGKYWTEELEYDFCNNLQAMHVIEQDQLFGIELKDQRKRGVYLAYLEAICAPKHLVFATAREKVEAFLLALAENSA